MDVLIESLLNSLFSVTLFCSVTFFILWRFELKEAKRWFELYEKTIEQRDKVAKEYYDLLDTITKIEEKDV